MASIERAALWPAAIASTTNVVPVTASPPAKIPGTLVASVSLSTATVRLRRCVDLVSSARRKVGLLTDGKDDHIARNDGFGIRYFVKVGAAFDKAAEIHVDRPHARDVTVLVRHLFERAARHDLDAFFARVADFPIVRGHLSRAIRGTSCPPTSRRVAPTSSPRQSPRCRRPTPTRACWRLEVGHWRFL